MAWVYRVERIERLRGLTAPLLQFERQFGPPADFPHAVLERVRKQLPTTRAVYKLEFRLRPPMADLERKNRVLLRFHERNELLAELTRVPDERSPSEGVVYFSVDDAVSPTNRLSPNLYLPFGEVSVLVAGNWMPLSFSVIAALAGMGAEPSEKLVA